PPFRAFDFNADSRADLFWRSTTGGNAVWFMRDAVQQNVVLNTVPDTAWKPQALGDFDNNGSVDVFWRNTTTTAAALWLSSGGTFTNVALPAIFSDPAWSVVGSGDFDGNGTADLFWRNSATGHNAVSLMFGGSPATYALPRVDSA